MKLRMSSTCLPSPLIGHRAAALHCPTITSAGLLYGCVLAIGLVAAISFLQGCIFEPAPARLNPAAAPTITAEPTVRIRIVKAESAVTVHGPGKVRIGPADHSAESRVFKTPLTLRHTGAGFLIKPQSGHSVVWALPTLMIAPESRGGIVIDGNTYPHVVTAHPVSTGNPDAGRLDLVNHTPMEQYLPGVLQGELYGRWHPTTFHAQAIAARSYAITHLAPRRHYDLEATSTSQVYTGSGAHARARRAAERTRGIVLWHGQAVLPAYYSSSCGGAGQDAAIAFPFGPNVPPLRGRLHNDWCSASPKFRWGPIGRNRDDLARRIAAWGQAKHREVAKLSGIASIRVAERNMAGRPARFTITDRKGQTFDLPPEEFRFACNHRGQGLASLPSDQRLASSYTDVRVDGPNVWFNGRGFGHGIGLCQWGAQKLATLGYPPDEILAYYYPEASLRRLYP